jgi:hypothetical protein
LEVGRRLGRGLVARPRVLAFFFPIELPLDRPEHVVVDGASVARQEDRLALRVDDRAGSAGIP